MPLWEKRKSFVVLILLVSFHLILISVQVPLAGEKTFFEKSVFFLFSPVQKAVVFAVRGIGSVWSNYLDLRAVRGENQRLRRELFFLNQEKRYLADSLQFFRSEAQVRDSLARFRASIIPARIIGADAANIYRSVILDRGGLAGVTKDMAVCDRFGNLVGRTIDPSAAECMVQLITDQESSVSVIVEADRTVGLLGGRSQALCSLKYVLASAPGGKEGDELVTTGFDQIYPAGIRVGRIVSVQPSTSIFKVILVKPYFNFSALEAVGILPAVSEDRK
jgi:rod shape-determining protein MreC